jgi:hypothetical protein
MKAYIRPQVAASYTLDPAIFAAHPQGTVVPVRQDAIPRHVLEQVCDASGLSLVGLGEHQYEDGVQAVYLLRAADA